MAARPGYAQQSLKAGDDAKAWAAAFIGLEAAGWKGQRGTALQRQPGMAEAFVRAAEALHAAGLLRFWRIVAGQQPIAMVMAIVERGHASFSKIAYDESHARFSPGALIILEATRSLFEEGGIKLIDSCAIPNHPMLDNIWRDRIAMADVMVAGSGVGTARFAVAVVHEKLRRKLRGLARHAYYRFSGQTPS